jgi:two-component system, NarL family, response regulator LiaR
MNPVRLALVDDHRVVSQGVKVYLESFADLNVCGIATSGEELLENLLAWRPHLVIVDLMMPGGWDGIETTRRIKAKTPAVKVIALTASTDEPRMVAVLRAGASGYVRKDADPEVLLAAVRAVARGESYVDPSVKIVLTAPPEELTAREKEILVQLASGRSNKEIATVLAIGEETVKTHVARLMAKLHAENRAQAIVQALKRGVVSMEELA